MKQSDLICDCDVRNDFSFSPLVDHIYVRHTNFEIIEAVADRILGVK